MSKQSAEDYLDKLLNSVNGEEGIIEDIIEEGIIEADIAETDILDEMSDFGDVFGELTQQAEADVQMVSKRVSKSEDDFLKEFEAELEEDDFLEVLKGFEDLDDASDVPYDVDDIQFTQTPVVEELPDAFMDMSEMDAFPEMEELPEMEALPEMPEDDLGSMNLADLFAETQSEFEATQTASEEISQMNDVTGPDATMDSFSLGGVDLGSLFEDEDVATTEMPQQLQQEVPQQSVEEEDPFAGFEEVVMPEMAAMGDGGEAFPFGDIFGDAGGGSGDGIDLGNMGEEDLMSLLSGDGLGDIGDLLSQNESGQVSGDTLDAFSAFAEGEMLPSGLFGEDATTENKKSKPKKELKGGFLEKLSLLLFGEDDEEEETLELGAKKAPTAGELSNENAAILAALDSEETGKEKKGKKEKKKKEPKPKKEKAPKPPKPKKEKKPKEKKPVEIDNTPPLKKGPVFMIVLMVASLFGLVMLGTNLVGYATAIAKATSFYQNGQYAEGYEELLGVELNQNDMELYNQVATLATVDSELNAYKVFYKNNRMEEAIDSLICAAGRCRLNADNAEIYKCEAQLETLRKEVANELSEKFGMSYKEAIQLYNMDDRDDYTIALKEKIKAMGLVVE